MAYEEVQFEYDSVLPTCFGSNQVKFNKQNIQGAMKIPFRSFFLTTPNKSN